MGLIAALPTDKTPPRKRIAVIGSGITGLSAAWLLGRSHDVTLFECDSRLGGHSNTVMAPTPSGPIAVDTGFIVFNEPNYPNLTAMLAHLGVRTQPTHMSFGVSLDEGALEYCTQGVGCLFAQRRNWASPKYWRMVKDILRFQKAAPKELPVLEASGETLDAWLGRSSYGPLFRNAYLLPQAAAIWSCSQEQMCQYPAAEFVRFYMNHNLLKYSLYATWRTIMGGSREYVSRLASALTGPVMLNARIDTITRDADGPTLVMHDGSVHHFDAVLLATHSDQALALLEQPTLAEREILGAIRYRQNKVLLHRDAALMPRRRRAWAAWTHMGSSEHLNTGGVTYWMNELQSLPGPPLFVSLNPAKPPRSELVIGEWDYDHPVFDTAAVAAQKQVWSLQGEGGVWFAGAWMGAGFHEDGLQAGLAAAEDIGGVRRPWTVPNESGRIFLPPSPAPEREAA